MQEYHMKLKQRLGTKMGHVDILSRNPLAKHMVGMAEEDKSTAARCHDSSVFSCITCRERLQEGR